MDLDFKTVRALSSPTRIKILSHSLKGEATPTNTAKEIGRSKSTVSSHLEKLVDAGLLDKNEEDGRKRVVYSPTKKAKAIVQGRERKVKFSIASSAITGLAGLAMLNPLLDSQKPQQDTMNSMMLQSDTARNAAETGLQATLSDPFLYLSAGFMVLSLSALAYGLILRSL